MKTLFLLWFMVLLPARSAQAGNIVLLTSLKISSAKIKKIEMKFKASFGSLFQNLKVYHSAGPTEVFQILRSPETIAAIWVSHASKETKLVDGFEAREIIQDIWGNDIRQFFSTVHPNLRYLGIVGCQTKGIFEKYETDGHYTYNPDLVIQSEEKKVELFRSLDRALKKGIIALSMANIIEDTEDNQEQITFQIKRDSGKSGWLVLGDEILSTISEDHFSGHYEASYPREKWNNLSNRNIRFVENLQYKSEKNYLGTLRITMRSEHSARWIGFKGKDGVLIGREKQNLYIYKNQQ